MAENNTYNPYTLADIERYLQGKMNAREMHEMEKAALQDPFLSDSIEGYSHAPLATAHAHLNEIAASITGEKQQAKVVAMPVKGKSAWSRIAAAAIIIAAVAVSWLLLDKTSNSPEKKIANIPVMPVPKTQDSQPVSSPPLENATAKVEKPEQDRKKNNASSGLIYEDAQANAKANLPVTARAYKSASPADDVLKAAPSDTTVVFGSNFAHKSLVDRKADAYRADTLKADLAAGYFNTKVYSNNAMPKGPLVNQLNMASNQSNFSTTTADSFGRLNLSIDKAKFGDITNAKEVAAIVEKRSPYKESYLRIQLTPTPGFDSSIPVTYLNNKVGNQKMVIDSTLTPQGGWEGFRDYVSKRIHKEIDTTTEAMIEGDVELEFAVDDKGFARDIKITKSLNQQSDAEAMDIIRKWPSWITTKKNRKNKVVIQF